MTDTTATRRNRKPVTAAIETATTVATQEGNMKNITDTASNTAVIAAPVEVLAPVKRTRRAAAIDPGAAAALRVILSANPVVTFVQDNRKPGKEAGTTVGAFKFLHVQNGKIVNITRLFARAMGVAANVNGAILTTAHAETIRADLSEGLELPELTFEESF